MNIKFSSDKFAVFKSTAIILGVFGGVSALFIFGSNPGRFSDFLKFYPIIVIAFVGIALYEKWWGLVIENGKHFYGLGLLQRRNKLEISSLISLLFYTSGRGAPMLAVYYKNPGATYKSNRRFWITHFIPSTVDELIQKIQIINPSITVEKSPDFIKVIHKEQKGKDKVPNKPWGIYYQTFLYFFTAFSIVFIVFTIVGVLT